MSEVALNLENYTVEGKLALSGNVAVQIPLHAIDFPGETPVVAALELKRGGLADALVNEMSANTAAATARTLRLLAEAEHDEQLKVTARFAEQVTNFDGPKLESAGFTLAKPSLPIGPLPAPINLRSVAGAAPGSINVSCKSVVGSKTYQGQCATSPTGPWTLIYNGTRVRFTCDELTSGTVYYFRMAATGSAGQSPWSDITERRAP